MSLCFPVGILYDRGYLRSLVSVGTLLEVLGLVATSLCRTYWQIVLAQGIACGLGSGIIAILPAAGIARWFVEKRLWATGLGVSGAALAGIIYPLILTSLTSRIGFGWSVRCLALIILGSSSIVLAILRHLPSDKAESGPQYWVLDHLKDLPYVGMMTSRY